MSAFLLKLAAIAIASIPVVPAVQEARSVSAEGLELLKRTKEVDSTYSLYIWNSLSMPGRQPSEEWSAEFHSGDRHRVETPTTRVIADCRTRTGKGLSVETGETVEGPQVADVACGISTNADIMRVERVGTVSTRFGSADRVRVVDRNHVREYDISPEGILLRTVYSEPNDGGAVVLVAEAVELTRELPDEDMFSSESLERSFVSEAYRKAR